MPYGALGGGANSYTDVFHPSNDELCRGVVERPTAP